MSSRFSSLQRDEKGQLRWVNQRHSVRYQCALATAGKIYPEPGPDWMGGWLLDLSKGGAGLLLNRPLPLHLGGTLQVASSSTRDKFAFPARVVHATEQISGDWLIGLKFDQPLTDDQLEALL